jgi:hypothetical protein
LRALQNIKIIKQIVIIQDKNNNLNTHNNVHIWKCKEHTSVYKGQQIKGNKNVISDCIYFIDAMMIIAIFLIAAITIPGTE